MSETTSSVLSHRPRFCGAGRGQGLEGARLRGPDPPLVSKGHVARSQTRGRLARAALSPYRRPLPGPRGPPRSGRGQCAEGHAGDGPRRWTGSGTQVKNRLSPFSRTQASCGPTLHPQCSRPYVRGRHLWPPCLLLGLTGRRVTQQGPGRSAQRGQMCLALGRCSSQETLSLPSGRHRLFLREQPAHGPGLGSASGELTRDGDRKPGHDRGSSSSPASRAQQLRGERREEARAETEARQRGGRWPGRTQGPGGAQGGGWGEAGGSQVQEADETCTQTARGPWSKQGQARPFPQVSNLPTHPSKAGS